MIALVIAVAGGIAAEVSGVNGWSHLSSTSKNITVAQSSRIMYVCGAAAFLVFGLAAAIGLSDRVRSSSQQLIGQAHAGILRYVLLLVGVFAVITIELAIGRIDVRQLLVSGAVAGVLLGIAAQQSLANLFAGLVLLFAHPFRVGDHIRFRAGAIGGQLEGIVIDLSLTYVRLQTDEGQVLLPNSQALAAAVLLVPDQLRPQAPGPTGPAPGPSPTPAAVPPGAPSAPASPHA